MENGSKPANLCINHLHFLLENDFLFARKFNKLSSNNLCDIIDKYLLNTDNNNSFSDIFVIDSKKQTFTYQIFNKIVDYIKKLGINDGIDVGCGIGLYVYNLRMIGFPIIGYDNNKNIVDFSKIIFNDDSVCEFGDITEDVEVDSTFGLAICFDVLSYLSLDKVNKALSNLKRITNTSIIISLKKSQHNDILHNEIQKSMQKNHEFHNNIYFSAFLSKFDYSYIYYVFEKNHLN